MRAMKRIVSIFLLLSTMIAFSQRKAESPDPEKSATVGGRDKVDLTIYNANLALVREERTLDLKKGLSHVIIPDIPATIDGTSLHFLSLTDPGAVKVIEQNYQYDLVHQAKLLEKYLGRTVDFVRVDPSTQKEYTVQGKLLSTGYRAQPQGAYDNLGNYLGTRVDYQQSSGMVAEINGKIEINPAGRIVLPSLPEGLILKPQLDWLIDNTNGGEHRAEISYLASDLSWNSNYVALVNKGDNALDLTGWVTLTNNCGTSFHDAGLKLVAGDIHFVRGEVRPADVERGLAKESVQAPQFKQAELFEYYIYTLQRHTDINNNETKQIELVSSSGVPAKKMFIYDGLAGQWRSWRLGQGYRDQASFGQQSNPKVGVFLTFRNEQKSGLGIPLPKGKVRVYKRDDDGKEQFVGEDLIDHTPKDEEIRLYLGDAFDLVGERAQKDFRTIVSGHVYDETFEIKVRNHKSEEAEVLVYEHPWRWNQWEITKSSTDWVKVDQTTIRFPVRIPKDGEKVISYTIRYTW
ncbi:MAG: hypothetical protein WBW16_14915 [Bacteroidota bacterium]